MTNSASPGENESTSIEVVVGHRRGWLKATGAALIGALSAVVAGRAADTAFADVTQTSPTTNTGANYGLSAAPATTAPAAPVSGTYGLVGAAEATSVSNLTNSPPGTSGVLGGATSGSGVYGVSGSGVGVQGSSQNIGIQGTGNNFGLVGASSAGQGLNGQSNSGIGLVGSSSGGQPGVYGTSSSGPGIFGTTTGGGLAALFSGPVQVAGTLTVSGIKSAAVPHPDGSIRRLYCLESPVSYFEDFGVGHVVGGRGKVKLDPDFAAIVHSDSYFVYLTAEGDSKGLYVSAKAPTGFEVREQQGGTASVAFSYRVVARRRDVESPRLAHVSLPGIPHAPKMPSVALPQS
jgi:hypothetical protein